MTLLSKEQILKAEDIKKELVSVPEWGGDVYVRMLTGAQRDAYEASMINQRSKSREMNLVNLRARLCVLCIVDADGKRLFDDTEIVKLGNKSASALDKVFTAAQKLNGISAEDIEELAKNSDEGRSGDSTTDSQAT